MPNDRTITSEGLAKLAKEGETHAVVLELHDTGSTFQYHLTGKTNKIYVFKYCLRRCRHVLVVPVSVWMADNAAMARDILERRAQNVLVPLVERIGESTVVVKKRVEAKQPEAAVETELTEEEINAKAQAALAL